MFLKKIAFDGVCEYSEDFFEKCEMRQDGLEQDLIFFGKILICFPDFSYKSVFYFCFLKYGILNSMQNFIYVHFFLGMGSGFFHDLQQFKKYYILIVQTLWIRIYQLLLLQTRLRSMWYRIFKTE